MIPREVQGAKTDLRKAYEEKQELPKKQWWIEDYASGNESCATVLRNLSTSRGMCDATGGPSGSGLARYAQGSGFPPRGVQIRQILKYLDLFTPVEF